MADSVAPVWLEVSNQIALLLNFFLKHTKSIIKMFSGVHHLICPLKRSVEGTLVETVLLFLVLVSLDSQGPSVHFN